MSFSRVYAFQRAPQQPACRCAIRRSRLLSWSCKKGHKRKWVWATTAKVVIYGIVVPVTGTGIHYAVIVRSCCGQNMQFQQSRLCKAVCLRINVRLDHGMGLWSGRWSPDQCEVVAPKAELRDAFPEGCLCCNGLLSMTKYVLREMKQTNNETVQLVTRSSLSVHNPRAPAIGVTMVSGSIYCVN